MLNIIMAVAAAVFCFALMILLFDNPEKRQIAKRMDRLEKSMDIESVHDAVLTEKKKSRKQKRKNSFLVSKRFEEHLSSAGIKMNAQEYIILWFALTIGPIVFGSLLRMSVITIIGVSIIGFMIPQIMVNRAQKKKQQLFNKQLGEALTIMSNCLRSGYSFQQTLNSVAQEMPAPISTEFGRVIREVQYGAQMKDALNRMVERTQNKDLELLVSAVLTSMQVGANLSEILDTISDTVHERIRLREEIRVMSAQGRMSGLIIGCLPLVVILFLMLTNPNYFIEFAENPMGKMMLMASVIMEVMGFLVINKIVDIKY